MILNQPDFFARSATLDGAITDADTQITLTGLSTRFTDAVAAGTAGYEATGASLGPFRISDDDGFELIAITGHVSGSTFDVERGIQGTTAEAWADSTSVRAVVTRDVINHADLGGRDRIFATSPTADTNIIVDGFNRSDRPIDGDTLPTGNTWSLVAGSGDAYIEGKALKGDGTILTPLDGTLLAEGRENAYTIRSRINFYAGFGAGASTLRFFIYVNYIDPDNWVRWGMSKRTAEFEASIDGVVTTLNERNITSNWFEESSGEIWIDVTQLDERLRDAYIPLLEGDRTLTLDTEVMSIINNPQFVGIDLVWDIHTVEYFIVTNK